MTAPEIQIGCVSNLFSRQMTFKLAGDVMEGHKHIWDHLTLLAYGKLSIDVEGVITEFDAPHMIYIQKNKNHTLTALQDQTVAYCIHALRNPDGSGDILDPEMIPEGINPFTVAEKLIINE